MKSDSIYFQLILKELDTIQDIIKNLDTIIHNSKNFAFLILGGGLYLIVQHLEVDALNKALLVIATTIIPILFWAMDYKWRKHILQSSARMKIISLFINSSDFKKLISGELEDEINSKFPLYDPVGWIFTKKVAESKSNYPYEKFDPKYFRDENEINPLKVLGYKDSYLFFGTLTLLSLILGIIMLIQAYGC